MRRIHDLCDPPPGSSSRSRLQQQQQQQQQPPRHSGTPTSSTAAATTSMSAATSGSGHNDSNRRNNSGMQTFSVSSSMATGRIRLPSVHELIANVSLSQHQQQQGAPVTIGTPAPPTSAGSSSRLSHHYHHNLPPPQHQNLHNDVNISPSAPAASQPYASHTPIPSLPSSSAGQSSRRSSPSSGVGHPCDRCGRVFTRRADAAKHIRVVHDRVKNFVCDLCGRRFGRKDYLIVSEFTLI